MKWHEINKYYARFDTNLLFPNYPIYHVAHTIAFISTKFPT